MPTNVSAVAGATVSPDPAAYAARATSSASPLPSLAGTGQSPLSLSQVSASSPANGLDKDTFLKLLVAQLKYQDPMNPSTSEDFIATTAQFTVVEKLDQLTQQSAASALLSSLTTASSLVGRTVTTVQDGMTVETVVQRSRLISGEVVLETDRGTVRLNEIISVGPSALTVPSPTAPAPDQPQPAPPATDPPITDPPANDPTANDPTANDPTANDPLTTDPLTTGGQSDTSLPASQPTTIPTQENQR